MFQDAMGWVARCGCYHTWREGMRTERQNETDGAGRGGVVVWGRWIAFGGCSERQGVRLYGIDG